jgi:hypothetical protein
MRGGGKLRSVMPNRRLLCAALCVSVAVSATASSKPKPKPAAKQVPKMHLEQAYFNGDLVKLQTGPYEKGERTLIVGPWNMGPKVSPKPSDKRPNLYFVIPGTLHSVDGSQHYDHTEILSYAPDDPKEFDVYWAVVLDPNLKEDFTAEPQLLVAAQQTFAAGEDFTFEQIPSAKFLESLLKISSLDKLEKYRRPDGNLPRVAIITGGFAVRLSVEKPEEEKTAETPVAEH